MILKKVQYPPYLMGGIQDSESPRDYVRNAEQHVGARILIVRDIVNFFPSVTASVVFDIWRQFFHFPREVAQALTDLTTLDGTLPQGAKTSTYLANLVFWAREPTLVDLLAQRDFLYTRYVDDLAISSKQNRTAAEIARVISMLLGMVKHYGLKVKPSKPNVFKANGPMEITGLNVAGGKVSLSREERSAIRAAVYQCEEMVNAPQFDVNHLRTMLRSVDARVAQLSRFHETIAQGLMARVAVIKSKL